jgi:hypothetical protein
MWFFTCVIVRENSMAKCNERVTATPLIKGDFVVRRVWNAGVWSFRDRKRKSGMRPVSGFDRNQVDG